MSLVFTFNNGWACFVARRPWHLLRHVIGTVRSYPFKVWARSTLSMLVLGRDNLDPNTSWRIARDLCLCPKCGKNIRERLYGCNDDMTVEYTCVCGWGDEMEIS